MNYILMNKALSCDFCLKMVGNISKYNCPYSHVLSRCTDCKTRPCEQCKNQQKLNSRCFGCNATDQITFLMGYCLHKYCQKCVKTAFRLQLKKCHCDRPFDGLMFNDALSQVLKQNKQKTYSITCAYCNSIKKMQCNSAPTYLKCPICSALTCIEHQALFHQCKCKCPVCFLPYFDAAVVCKCQKDQKKAVKQKCQGCSYSTFILIENKCKFCFLFQ